uniref:uncharacterized protein n=1 Tax=Semicossyphus pulcher TaxID=241346 RepID=UPI0037E87D32
MSEISEKDWKNALMSILEELDKNQYNKMLEYLKKIPKSQRKSFLSKEKMPATIIEYYGLRESISAVNEAMDNIPRRDAAVQELLQPFVDQLKRQHEIKRGEKRKREAVEEEEEPAVATPLKHVKQVEEHEQAEPPRSCPPAQERNDCPWKKNISDVKSKDVLLETEAIVGKVVQKSGVRTYQTKDKKKKFFFYMAVADGTASVKVMVYGKEHYRNIKEESSYLFRRLIKDQNVVKVTTSSKVSSTKPVQVPEEVEVEARKLIYPESPPYSVAEAKSCSDGTDVSLEGTVEEIDPIEDIKVSYQQEKKKRQRFKLKDETDAIWIFIWGDETQQSKDLTVGDVIKITNIKSHQFHETRSMNSTVFTKIHKVKSAGVHQENIQIIGIIKATKKETQLEAEFNQQVHTLVVASKLLAKEFDIKLDGDFNENLLKKLNLNAEAEIKGNRIKKITAA